MQRIQHFWQQQVLSEYGSAAVTTEFTHWLIQLGSPPELIRQALTIAQDEMDHAAVCYSVANDAGCHARITGEGVGLRLPTYSSDLRQNFCAALLDFYCLGETAAVPLFAAMRKQTTQTTALAAFDRIIKDEPRHSAFGWLALAWADDAWPETSDWLQTLFPAALQRMAHQYHCKEEFAQPLTDIERSWGLLPRLAYTRVFEDSILNLYAKHLKYYGIDVSSVWSELELNPP